MTEEQRSSGVQELITRLREEGVEGGQVQAKQLVEEARRQADEMLDQTRREAEELLQRARKEAASLRTAGQAALQLARRDVVLSLKDEVTEQFADAVRRLVRNCLAEEEFIQRLILQIAGRAAPEGQDHDLEFLLPEQMPTVEELQRQPGEFMSDKLSQFVSTVARDLLEKGITFGVAGGNAPGLTVRVVDEDVEINLTDESISELLLQHLLPRFRTMMNHTA